MSGRGLMVNALKKYQAGMIAMAFWLYNAWNAVHVSRLIGYVPPHLREAAQARAFAQPYPWDSIVGVWVLFAIATAGGYYIVRDAPYKAFFLAVYAAALFACMGLFMRLDAGRVHYAMGDFPFNALYLAALFGVGSAISSARARWGGMPDRVGNG